MPLKDFSNIFNLDAMCNKSEYCTTAQHTAIGLFSIMNSYYFSFKKGVTIYRI